MTRRRTHWGRISRGVLLIGVGSVLLTNTLGILPWALWLDALAYWPVLLVALGIRLLFDRSRMPALVLLAPLLVLATLVWVGVRAEPGPGAGWTPLRAERPEAVGQWRLSGATAFARLDLEARPLAEGLLVDGRAASRRRPEVRVSGSGDGTRVRFGARERVWGVMFPRHREDWQLGVSPEPPFRFDLSTAFSSGKIDLSAATVSSVSIDGAFNRLTVKLGEPAEDVRVDLEGAFNTVTLIVPQRTPVSVRTDGFMNVVRGRDAARDAAGPRYRVRVDGAFASLRVRSD